MMSTVGDANAQASVPTPVPEVATVVFYQPAVLARAAINYTLRANGAKLCRLSNKRYFTVRLQPGATSFISVAGGLAIPDKEKFDLTLEAGKVYFIQGDIKVRFMTEKLVFTEVTESTYKNKSGELKPDKCEAAVAPAAPAALE